MRSLFRVSRPFRTSSMPRSGIKIIAETPGTGRELKKGDRVRLRYDIQLNRGDFLAKDQEAVWTVGDRNIVAGFRYGMEGMRAGGTRRFRASPHLCYRDAEVSRATTAGHYPTKPPHPIPLGAHRQRHTLGRAGDAAVQDHQWTDNVQCGDVPPVPGYGRQLNLVEKENLSSNRLRCPPVRFNNQRDRAHR